MAIKNTAEKKAEVKEVLEEVDSLKKIEKHLKEEIARLQAIQNSLENQEHTAQIKNEQDDKIRNAEMLTKYANEERLLETKRIEVEGRIDLVEKLELNLKNREKEVEKRELRLVDLENKLADLNTQRSNFEAFKVSIMAQLDQAQETINQSKELVDNIEAEKCILSGREAKVKEQEKYWNDTIGLLEADKKQFLLEKENFIGLQKSKKEAGNVKG